MRTQGSAEKRLRAIYFYGVRVPLECGEGVGADSMVTV